MKITKILVALSFLFAVTTANAGTLTVTGNMEATYQSDSGKTTGNPLGIDRELKFAGSTELDNGITVSVMQDTGDTLLFSNSQIAFSNDMGTLYIGSDSDPVDSIDDVTPSAYEEANGSGSGTYVDIGGSAGDTGLGIKVAVPYIGAVNYKFYPKADGSKNADNTASADNNADVGSANVVSIVTSLGDLPGVGVLSGATLTTGYAKVENSNVANTDDELQLTAALNYAYGPVKFGYQKKYNNQGQTVGTTDAIFYRDDIIGVAYAVNDALSLSYNRYESKRHSNSAANADQTTTAYNIGYAIGGMTIGFQSAETDNANFVNAAKDDTKTLGVSVAF
jgi:hypothetical protein